MRIEFLKTLFLEKQQRMAANTEELLRKLSDKIAEIYDLEFAEEFTEIFEDLASRMKDKSKRHWRLVKKLAAIEKEHDEERRARALVEYDVDYLAKELDEERCARARAEDDVERLMKERDEERIVRKHLEYDGEYLTRELIEGRNQ